MNEFKLDIVDEEETTEITSSEIEQPEITIETHKLFAPQRLEDEGYIDYCERRKVAHYRLHLDAKGKMIWNSREQGTYRKAT